MGQFLTVPRILAENSPPQPPGNRVIGWHFDYVISIGAIAAGATSPLTELQIQLGAPFCLRAIGGYNISAGNAVTRLADCLVTFTNDNDNFLQSEPIGVLGGVFGVDDGGDWATGGINGLYEPVHNQVTFAPNSVMQIRVKNNGLAGLNNVVLVFRGTKLHYENRIFCPSYPSRYTSLPYQYPVQFPPNPLGLGTITIPASTIIRDIPVQAFGTDYVLRGGVMHLVEGSIANVQVRLKDQTEKPYSNDFIHWNWLFADSKADRPGIWYPEIYLPKDRILLVDVQQNEAAVGVFQMCFEGSRVFPK